MTRRDIELHIEELVLHGFASGDRYRIGEAVERELARLFVEQGTPPSLPGASTIEHLDGGTFEVKAGSEAGAIGVQVAQAVFEGLNR